jgi:hypothetical protein
MTVDFSRTTFFLCYIFHLILEISATYDKKAWHPGARGSGRVRGLWLK